MTRVLVIGGGIGGLAAAYFARKAGHSVTICEASDRWGGVTQSEQRDGFLLELGPDSVISTKPAALELIKELGLEDQVIGTRPQARKSLIGRGRQLLPVPERVYLMAPGKMMPFLRSPLLSWAGKFRMACDLFIPRRAQHMPEESLAQFVRRRLGREALERLAQPLIGGIYTADPRSLSLAATMPQFLDMERDGRSLLLGMMKRSRAAARAAQGAGNPGQAASNGARYGLFISMREGLGQLTTALRQQLPDDNCLARWPVQQLQRTNAGWIATANNGEQQAADHVCLALPAWRSAALLRDATPRLSEQLNTIPYADIATVNLAFDAAQVPNLPEAAGFVVPAIDHKCLVACTFVHAKYPDRAPAGRVLLRAFVGGALHGDALAGSDEQVVAQVMGELRWRLGITGAPLFYKMTRWPKAMAQYTCGHQGRVAGIHRLAGEHPGLHLMGNGFNGVGLPDMISLAKTAVDSIE